MRTTTRLALLATATLLLAASATATHTSYVPPKPLMMEQPSPGAATWASEVCLEIEMG
jgi:hypothetical protein